MNIDKVYVYFNDQSFKCGFYWYWCGFFDEVYKSNFHNIPWYKGEENLFYDFPDMQNL